jgi:hypothetical protein
MRLRAGGGRWGRWLAVFILLLSHGLAVTAMAGKSPTVDEQSHLFRGVAYASEGADHFLWGHPLFASTLNALPLLTEPGLRLPQASEAWAEGDWAVAGDLFLWQLNSVPQRLILLGRLATTWLALLLGALVYRWGRQLGGGVTGVVALALVTLDPNVLAHGALVTSDVPLSLFLTAAVYLYWRWTRQGNTRLGGAGYLVAGGVVLGAAGMSKANAGLSLPALLLLALVMALRRRSWRPLLALGGMVAVAAVTIIAFYRFEMEPLPGGAWWDDFFWQLAYLQRPHGAYLAGRTTDFSWWYYFPAALLFKTPLPALAMWGGGLVALGLGVRARWWSGGDVMVLDLAFLLGPAVTYLGLSLASPLNIGYRHLIPLLPFLAVFAAVMAARVGGRGSAWARPAGVVAALLVAVIALAWWPNYIPYFNELAGGSTGGWRLLSDSNVDWGQDLPALAAWQREAGETIKLSYFGVAHPSAYAIDFEPLPTWEPAPEQGDPARQPYNPADPAPGLYAISVTNLHGLALGPERRESFAFFREQEPLARIGGSIFVYRVGARGEAADVVFAGVRPADLEAALYQRLGTNDVRPRWLEAESAFLWPAGGGWLATGAAVTPTAELLSWWPTAPVAAANGQALYRLEDGPAVTWAGQGQAVGDVAQFLGYRRLEAAEGEVALLTAWELGQRPPAGLKIFVHALDEAGAISGQWDGLGVDAATLRLGDQVVQMHRFVVPAGEPLLLSAGMYDGETMARFGEAIVLEAVE